MANHTPYLQRRGDSFSFRIAVPSDLLPIIGKREFTKSLQTTDKRIAVVKALMLAATAKQLFHGLKSDMSKPDKLRQSLFKQTRKPIVEDEDDFEEGEGLSIGFEMEIDLDELGFLKGLRVEAEPHEQEAVNSAIKTVLEHSPKRSQHLTPTSALENVAESRKIDFIPMFSTVVEGFLNSSQRIKKLAMSRKHKTVLPMLIEIIGDKPINQIKQADINGFFALLEKLPPRWPDERRKRKLSIKALAELDHPIKLGPKTIEDTYKACVRSFLITAKKDWQDQGFPLGLTTDGIEYSGNRSADESKQRAFNEGELKRLFEGSEMESFANDPNLAHCFWLPHIGLFTGARVNEICQLNPQVDIYKEVESDVWCLWINDKSESDPRIRKSVKSKHVRKVPIHSKLIELGFLEYVDRVKTAGAKVLFPQWKPINQKASGEAEKWFRRFLRDTKLRDETVNETILGMHAFRHTLLTYGAMRKPPLSLFCITGHVQGDLPIPANGAGRGYLTLSLLSSLKERKDLLDQLDYGLNFFKPKSV